MTYADWHERSVRMFRWAARAWWATWGAMVSWSVPTVRDPQVLKVALWTGGACGFFVLLSAFCFAMGIWKEGGDEG